MNTARLPPRVKPNDLKWDAVQQHWYRELHLLGRTTRITGTCREPLCDAINDIIDNRMNYHNTGLDHPVVEAFFAQQRRNAVFWRCIPLQLWSSRFFLYQKINPATALRWVFDKANRCPKEDCF